MNIEVGKAYRTRSGKKAVIKEDRGTGGYSLIRFGGVVDEENFNWSWSCDGRWAATDSEMDLISEWQEPEPELKIEAGKFYKLRNGKKAFVYWENPCQIFLSVEIDKDGEAETDAWCHKSNGRLFSDNEDESDIIGHWIDPPKPLEFWANVFRCDENGGLTTGVLRKSREECVNLPGVGDVKRYVRTSKFIEVIE